MLSSACGDSDSTDAGGSPETTDPESVDQTETSEAQSETTETQAQTTDTEPTKPTTTDAPPQTTVTQPATSETEPEPNGVEMKRLWIAAETVECVGVGPQTCLLVAESADGPSEYFYDSIEGFTHEPGTSYVIDVEVSEVVDPPEDGSSRSYRLIEIIESTTG
ncbi:MAG: DUF4377 domain-containing protein [Acidimicrobiales bacterium]